MGEKEVTELAGIGEVLGNRLKDKGFDKVCLCDVSCPYTMSVVLESSEFNSIKNLHNLPAYGWRPVQLRVQFTQDFNLI